MDGFVAFLKGIYALIKAVGGLAGALFFWFWLVPEHNESIQEYLPFVSTDYMFWGEIWFWCNIEIVIMVCLMFIGIDIAKGFFKD